MRRYSQTFDELTSRLSPIETDWRDELTVRVEALLGEFPEKDDYSDADLVPLLDDDFEAAILVLRLFSGLSKDEFTVRLRETGGGGPTGVKEYRRDKRAFVDRLEEMGVLSQAVRIVGRPVGWRDILMERLRSGRGTAIKGQKRGRFLEDAVEKVVRDVFGDAYDVRCRFTGASGRSTEKTDVAIPSSQTPRILIESKAYGATGSKQTDVLGDLVRIVQEKRDDTTLLLVTDGVTWKDRANDLRKLIQMQNLGSIARIYTQVMLVDLHQDLETLKRDHAL